MKSQLILPMTIATLTFAAFAYPQNRSVYTSTKTSECKTIKSDADGTGSYVGECSGVAGYKVQVVEGDIRQTLNLITPARKTSELNFWNFYSSFSSIGEKIEWRTKAAVPVAVIARYNVADPESSTKSRPYLMVAKVGRSLSCVTDVVGPGPKQNEEARILADAASGKSCKKAE